MQFCNQPGCSVIVRAGYCPRHRPQEQDRPNVLVRRWYRSVRWRLLRARVLARQPWCPTCLAVGVRRATVDVDHRTAHHGNPALFWDEANLQAFCHGCHSRKTRGEQVTTASARVEGEQTGDADQQDGNPEWDPVPSGGGEQADERGE